MFRKKNRLNEKTKIIIFSQIEKQVFKASIWLQNFRIVVIYY